MANKYERTDSHFNIKEASQKYQLNIGKSACSDASKLSKAPRVRTMPIIEKIFLLS